MTTMSPQQASAGFAEREATDGTTVRLLVCGAIAGVLFVGGSFVQAITGRASTSRANHSACFFSASSAGFSSSTSRSSAYSRSRTPSACAGVSTAVAPRRGARFSSAPGALVSSSREYSGPIRRWDFLPELLRATHPR